MFQDFNFLPKKRLRNKAIIVHIFWKKKKNNTSLLWPAMGKKGDFGEKTIYNTLKKERGGGSGL